RRASRRTPNPNRPAHPPAIVLLALAHGRATTPPESPPDTSSRTSARTPDRDGMRQDRWYGEDSCRQYAADEALEVIGFRNRGLHRMIRPLTQRLQHLHLTIQMARAGVDRIQERITRHVMAAGAAHQDAIALQHLHRHR